MAVGEMVILRVIPTAGDGNRDNLLIDSHYSFKNQRNKSQSYPG